MRTIPLLFVAIALIGCKSTPIQIVTPPPEQQPVVWIRGDVKNRAVPWDEELTLSRAIVAAEYKGLWDPHAISVVRAGQSYKISPRDLLKQRDDPTLLPGDIVVIER